MVEPTSILILAIISLITIPLSALLLMLTTKIFKLQDSSYKTALIVATIITVINFIITIIRDKATLENLVLSLVIGIIVFIIINLISILLIKKFYNTEWGRTLLVWLVWYIFNLILSAILGFIIIIVIIGSYYTGVG